MNLLAALGVVCRVLEQASSDGQYLGGGADTWWVEFGIGRWFGVIRPMEARLFNEPKDERMNASSHQMKVTCDERQFGSLHFLGKKKIKKNGGRVGKSERRKKKREEKEGRKEGEKEEEEGDAKDKEEKRELQRDKEEEGEVEEEGEEKKKKQQKKKGRRKGRGREKNEKRDQ